jgi:hypothetical protein
MKTPMGKYLYGAILAFTGALWGLPPNFLGLLALAIIQGPISFFKIRPLVLTVPEFLLWASNMGDLRNTDPLSSFVAIFFHH